MERDTDFTEGLTIDEALHFAGYGRFQRFLMFNCGVGYTADTVELLFLTFVLSKIESEFDVSSFTASFTSVFSTVGILIGAILWGSLSDRMGRRAAFKSSVAVTLLFGVLSGLVPRGGGGCDWNSCQIAWLWIARMGVGFGLGGNLAVDFVMFLEFVPPNVRGKTMMMLTMFGVVGVLYLSLLGYILLDIMGLGWRVYAIACAAPSGLLLALRWNVPESPRLLYSTGHLEKSWAVIMQIAHSNGNKMPHGSFLLKNRETRKKLSHSSDIGAGAGGYTALGTTNSEARMSEVRMEESVVAMSVGGKNPNLDNNDLISSNLVLSGEVVASEQASMVPRLRSSLSVSILVDPRYIKTSLLLAVLWFSLAFAYGGITLWLPIMLDQKNLTNGLNIYTQFLLMSGSEIPGLLLAVHCVDRIGRRRLLVLCCTGCAISTCWFAVVAGGLYSPELALIGSIGVYFFVVGAWASLYVYTPEVYPTCIRSSASAVMRIAACLGSIASPPLGAVLLRISIWAPLLIFAFSFCAGAIAASALPVETTLKPLEDTVTERISFNGGENVYAALGSESTESGFSRCSLEEPGISPCSLKDNSA